ncbi:hypothetical protein C6P44_002304 [Monosporozyma unispora]|nr:hypothetical protein C6P44_002304 [Kazachstania unispora]
MDKYTSIITDEKFSNLSLTVTKYPKTLFHWETLINFLITRTSPINKTIDPQLYQLITSTYENMLYNFPFLENYHIDYALFEYKLSHIKQMNKIFKRALLIFNNRSLLIWIQYLKMCNDLISNNKELFSKYELAENFIGLHYFSGEFWNLYLEQIKLRCNDSNKKYIILLRKLLELPIYNSSKYYALWLQQIDQINDLKQLTKFVSKDDLINKLKIDINFNGRRGPYLIEAKKLLKKFTKELCMVLQFQSLELYSLFESKIQIHYYTSNDHLIDTKEINTWIKYLDFTINLNIESLTHLNFQRALISLANYDIIWIKYAQWIIEYKEDFNSAKDILLQGLNHSLKKSSILKILYSLLVKINDMNSLQNILNQISESFDNSIENSDDFAIFWDYIQFNIFLQNSLPQSRYSSDQKSSNGESTSYKILLPEIVLNKIRLRLDDNNKNNDSMTIINAMTQLQTKDNTDIIEKVIFQYLINESKNKQFYQDNNTFWILYCKLIFFDPSKSYLEKRTKIVEEVWEQIKPSNKTIKKSLFTGLLNFCEAYLPEDIDFLHEKFNP